MNHDPRFADALFHADPVTALRTDLALALRAAAAHGLGEGVCNHFSVALPGDPDHFLLNPRGLMWNEVQAADIVLVDAHGNKLAGRHEVEPTACISTPPSIGLPAKLVCCTRTCLTPRPSR